MGADLISDSLYCQQHNAENVLYCVSDECLICPECCLFGEHKNHTFEKVDSLLKRFQLVRQKVHEVENVQELFPMESIDAIYAKNSLSVISKMEDSIALAESCFNKVIEKITEAKKGVINQIENLYIQSFSTLFKTLEDRRPLHDECSNLIAIVDKIKRGLSYEHVKIEAYQIHGLIGKFNETMEQANDIRAKVDKPIDDTYFRIASAINANIEKAFTSSPLFHENDKSLVLKKFTLEKHLNITESAFFSTEALVTTSDKSVSDTGVKNLADEFPGFVSIVKISGDEVSSVFMVTFSDPKSVEQFCYLDGINIEDAVLKITRVPVVSATEGQESQGLLGKRMPQGVRANVQNVLKKIKNASN